MKVGPFETGRVHQGDALELLRLIPDKSIPVIFTDPPYGHNNNDGDLIHRLEVAIPKRRSKYSTTPEGVSEEGRPILNDSAFDMERVVRGMLAEAGRILTPDSCVCCCCCGGGGPSPTFARLALWMDEKPLSFFHAVVWDKGGLGIGWRYRRNYEMVMIAHRRGGKLKWETESAGLDTANVVRIGKIIPGEEDHPTPKPVELILHFLRLHTKPGDLVLDPFSGAGTTGVACAAIGREFLGFELDPHWVEVGNRRIQATTQGMAPEDIVRNQMPLFQ